LLKKVLFTTPILEHPATGGPALRITNSIKALNVISELHVISRVSFLALGGAFAENHFRSMCHRFEYSPSARKPNLLNKIANYRVGIKNVPLYQFINLPFRVFSRIYNLAESKLRNYFDQDVRFIKNYIIKNLIDVIWFGYGNISYELMKKLKKAMPKNKMVCDTDSVWSRFILRELDVENEQKRRIEIYKKGKKCEIEEKDWVNFMEVTTAVSEVDAEYYRRISSDVTKIKLFSNVIDAEMYKKIPKPPVNFKKPCIYLAGTFWRKSPMEQSARWVIRDIFPIIKREIPNLYFYIIGKGSDTVLSDVNDKDITITGKVDTVLPYLCNSDVSIVPLKFESGTRFKILEAGACGIPIVSTTLGAEGINLENGVDIILADTAESFAHSIIRIINDSSLAKKLSLNCKKKIYEKFTIENLKQEGISIIDFLGG